MPRDVNGQYELPAGNPVVSGTIISTNWANDTMADLANALTNSLSRNGNGGMLAPFLNADGSQSAPGISWANEPSMGLWREGAQDMRLGVSGAPTQRWNDQGSQLWRNSQWEEILTQTGGGGDTTINNLVVTGSFTSPGIDDNANATAITIDASENVLVGKTSDSGAVTTDGINLRPAGYSTFTATTKEALQLSRQGTDGSVLAVYKDSTTVGGIGTADGDLTIRNATSDAMRIDASGNVGIGNNAGFQGKDAGGTPRTMLRKATDNSTEVITASGENIVFKNGSLEKVRIDSDGNLKVANGGRIYVMSSTGFSPFIGESANGLDFWTNTAKRMTIDSSGNVGIGTDDPRQKLVVSTADNGFELDPNASSGNRLLSYSRASGQYSAMNIKASTLQIDTSTAGTVSAVTVDAAGNVGIGVSSMDNPLQVGVTPNTASKTSGSAFDGGALRIDGNLANAGDECAILGGLNGGLSAGMGFMRESGATWGTALKFYTHSPSITTVDELTERMRIDSAGNVGIGTNAPASLLSVGEGDVTTGSFNESALTLQPGWTATSGLQSSTLMWRATAVDTPNAFHVDNTTSEGTKNFFAGLVSESGYFNNNRFSIIQDTKERLTVSTDGYVGIGTEVPAHSLDIAAQDSGVQLRIGRTNTTVGSTWMGADANGFHLGVGAYGGGNSVADPNGITVDTSGNLLVGTTSNLSSCVHLKNASGSAPLQVLQHYSTADATWYMQRFYNGSGANGGGITFNTSTLVASYNTTSDVRLKENIVDATAGNIDDLKVRSYDWKANGSNVPHGFIAQELETVAPYAVTKGEDEDDMWAVDYSKLVPMLVKEIQDLKAEVAALKS